MTKTSRSRQTARVVQLRKGSTIEMGPIYVLDPIGGMG